MLFWRGLKLAFSGWHKYYILELLGLGGGLFLSDLLELLELNSMAG